MSKKKICWKFLFSICLLHILRWKSLIFKKKLYFLVMILKTMENHSKIHDIPSSSAHKKKLNSPKSEKINL